MWFSDIRQKAHNFDQHFALLLNHSIPVKVMATTNGNGKIWVIRPSFPCADVLWSRYDQGEGYFPHFLTKQKVTQLWRTLCPSFESQCPCENYGPLPMAMAKHVWYVHLGLVRMSCGWGTTMARVFSLISQPNKKYTTLTNTLPFCWMIASLWKSWPTTNGNGKIWVIRPSFPCADVSWSRYDQGEGFSLISWQNKN